MELRITGIDELKRKLKPANVKKPALDALRRIVLKLESIIKAHTVVDTGRLRASILSRFQGEGAYVATNVNYAAAVEYGQQRGNRWFESRYWSGTTKVLGEGGSFTYGVNHLQDTLTEEEKKIASEICINVERS